MRVLVADDQQRVRSALHLLLDQEPDLNVVGEAGEAHSLLAQLQAARPDLVLLDWSLPGLPAIGSLPALRLACPHLLVIVLSGNPEASREALAAGADAFVSKVEPPERLLDAVHALSSGGNETSDPLKGANQNDALNRGH